MDLAGFANVTPRYVRSWGNDPLSRLLVAVWDLLGQDMSEVRLVSATKE
jgi:hypothetical protein